MAIHTGYYITKRRRHKDNHTIRQHSNIPRCHIDPTLHRYPRPIQITQSRKGFQ